MKEKCAVVQEDRAVHSLQKVTMVQDLRPRKSSRPSASAAQPFDMSPRVSGVSYTQSSSVSRRFL